MAESEEALEFPVLEKLKDLSQNGEHIDLKPKQEAAIRVQSVDRISLQSNQIFVGVKKILKASACISTSVQCKMGLTGLHDSYGS